MEMKIIYAFSCTTEYHTVIEHTLEISLLFTEWNK